MSQPESQHLLKDFCIAFNGTVDKSQITLQQAAMYVHMFYIVFIMHINMYRISVATYKYCINTVYIS